MMLNQQPPEKQRLGGGYSLAVHSVFYTLQGEGPFAGQPAVFVRLAGCNLQCPMCDTQYTSRSEYSLESLLRQIREATALPVNATCNLVVITGGEPMRQNIAPLVKALRGDDWRVQVETNGTLYCPDLPLDDDGFLVVCSPKAGRVHPKMYPHISAYKYVASAASLINTPDGLPQHALEHPVSGKLARPHAGFTGPVYLQPVGEQDVQANAHNLTAVVESCLRYGHTLCIQLHKLTGLE